MTTEPEKCATCGRVRARTWNEYLRWYLRWTGTLCGEGDIGAGVECLRLGYARRGALIGRLADALEGEAGERDWMYDGLLCEARADTRQTKEK